MSVEANILNLEPGLPHAGDRTRVPLSSRPLGEILTIMIGLDAARVTEALAVQVEKGGRLGEVLIQLKHANEEQISKALAAQFELEFRPRITVDDVDQELVGKLPIAFAKQFRILPIKRLPEGHVLTAIADPTETSAVDQARLLLGAPTSLVLATPSTVLDAINAAYDRAANESQRLVDDLEGTEDLADLTHEVEEAQDILEQGSDEAPIIRLVNSLLFRAVKERASDIHIEPYERDMAVRYRVDGVLKNVINPPKRAQNSIISRIKVMGGLNIAEKRLPQDGRIRIKIAGKDIDIRLSTTPTVHGERIVMRLLDKSATLLDLKDIGFDTNQLKIIQTLIDRPHGIILVTGPTGSGKTTTLYAALNKINTPDLNIMTIEDPVEYQLKGVSQTPVNAKINLTFANGLRSFLRQDPDVIMVGEIRDVETAEIAIQASLTGHLVFSTVHTNDAPGSITRLVDMGVEPFLVASSLVSAMAQRLVRVVCKLCREVHHVTRDELRTAQLREDQLDEFMAGTYFKPSLKGCVACNFTGYKGRSGIYEIMLVDEGVRALILKNADSNTIKKEAVRSQGMVLLREDGVRKASQGLTSLEEVMRVTEENVV
jgi:general secretion pathway protein E